MCLSIHILYFMFHCYVFVHPDFVFYVLLFCVCPSRFNTYLWNKKYKCGWTNTYKWNIKYKIWMEKLITVKHKIHNVNGQTHTYETKNTKCRWTNTYKILYFMFYCFVFVHPDFVFYISLVCVCPNRFCILCFTVLCLSIHILYFIFHCYVFVHLWNKKYKMWMDQYIQVKYKIQNRDGQTQNSET
jgi:hypothetical protein